MNVNFPSSRTERYKSVEKFSEATNLTHFGFIRMLHSQLQRQVLTKYTLELAETYYKRFYESLKNDNNNYDEVMNSDVNIAIILVVISLAIKISEDEPVIYFNEIVQYSKLGYFSEYIDVIDFNFLEREILIRLDFRM